MSQKKKMAKIGKLWGNKVKTRKLVINSGKKGKLKKEINLKINRDKKSEKK